MKLNKNKIIVSALALVIGTSLAGSVTGTLAWYQYSTRANVSFIGQSSGFSSNLQMRFVSEATGENAEQKWRTRITWQEMAAELAVGGDMKLMPMTFGSLDKDAALPLDNSATPAPLGYIQPIAGVKDMSKWGKATDRNYAQFKLQLRNVNHAGSADENVAEDVYLSKLVMQADSDNTANNNNKGYLGDAIRIHISSSYNDGTNDVVKNKLISSSGSEVATKGKLDLDGDGKNDQAYPDNDEFGFADKGATPTTLQDIVYGDDGDDNTNEVQTSYAKDSVLVYSDGNKLYNTSAKDALDGSKLIGKTVAGSNSYLTVTVTIWVEGWQLLDNGATAIWDAAKYIDSKFDIGLQFAVQDKLA